MTALQSQSRPAPLWSPPKTRVFGRRTLTIGPDLAMQLLAHNVHNRNLRVQQVERLASDMAACRWVCNGDSIRFDWNGNLIDGQHRLHAIVKSGMHVEMDVVWGLDPESQATIDINIIRKLPDTFQLAGHKNATVAVAVLRLMARWSQEEGLRVSGVKQTVASNAQLISMFEANPEIAESVAFVSNNSAIKKMLPPSTTAFCHLLFSQIDRGAADDFFNTMASGEDLKAGDPRLVMSKAASGTYVRGQSNITAQRVWVAMLIKAWNAWRDGKTVSLLRWSPSEKYPIPH